MIQRRRGGLATKSDTEARVGLCFTCRHARVIKTPRSTFWLCGLSATDPRFAKYPRLPVVACDGYARREDGTDPEEG